MEQEYVVQEGDNLSTILYNFTGDGSYANAARVAEQNGLSNPSHIEPGQTIRFTVENTNSSSTASTSSTTTGTSNGGTPSQSSVSSSNVPRSSRPSSSGVTQAAFVDSPEGGRKVEATADNQSSSSSIPNPKTNAASGSVTGLNATLGREKEFSTVQMDYSPNSPTSSSTVETTSSNTTPTPRSTTFSYGIDEDDSIEYNVEEARKILVGAIDPDIGKICGIITSICNTLVDLQKIAHDKENTNVAQDYKDFETIIGDEVSGLNGFVSDAFDVSLSVYETINEWERITQK